MRATVFVGTSLDGFIARANGGLDFLPEDPEPHGFEELLASVDALVMGRKTYEILLSFGGEWFYGETPVVVLSTRPIAPPPSGWLVEQMSGTPSEVVARLEARGMGHIYVDGGETIQRFLREGFVHRIIVTRVPVLIGEGIPLFGPLESDIVFRHVATRTFPSGLVQSEYEVVGARDAG